MSLADAFAGIAAGFADQFGAPFEDAVVRWPGTPVYDTGGSIVTPASPIKLPCKAQFDAPTQQMRGDPGFIEGDARAIVLAASLSGTLDSTARLETVGGKWAILTCTADSAGIGYECRVRRIAP